MMSAMVRIRAASGLFATARALLDTCSTVHLITLELAKRLQLPIRRSTESIDGVNALSTHTIGKTSVVLESMINPSYRKFISCTVIEQITGLEPRDVFPRDQLELPKNLPLADPNFHIPRPVDILIGAGTTVALLQSGQTNISPTQGDLLLQKTHLGWVVVGGLEANKKARIDSCCLVNLQQTLERFWEIEDLSNKTVKTTENDLCEKYYVDHVQRASDGKYVVKLPFRYDDFDLGESRSQALRRFYSLQRKLQANPELKLEYHKVMQEYLDLGHMSLVSDESLPGYYIPHHAVIKNSSTTTKLRVVFDASAKTSTDLSLNKVLMVGATIQDKLFEHLLRFRTHVFVITADIEKMYRQIWIAPEDRRYHRIFWYNDGHISVFNLNTVTFGVSSSPFLAIRTIHQLAREEATTFPLASSIVQRDLYVDDLLTGADSLDEVLRLRDEIINLLKVGGFNIRQWASNHSHALDNVASKTFQSTSGMPQEAISKTLGIAWNSQSDTLVYTSKPIALKEKFTKRLILSEIAKIFDPLGLLGPIVFAAKVIMQDCWRLKIGWDESVSQELAAKWLAFAEQLTNMSAIDINRRLIISQPTGIEIHGFCDASKLGYGACLYIRSTNSSNQVWVRLACSKSRVAPIKETTIPKLELCGALTLAKLYHDVRSTLGVSISRSILWSDSTIALAWIKKSPVLLKVFESNRVKEIQKLSVDVEWRYVGTKTNPADALSRGQYPQEFQNNSNWFQGPHWLSQPSSAWPTNPTVEVRSPPDPIEPQCLIVQSESSVVFDRFSSYSKLIVVISRCLRWRSSNIFKTEHVSVTERHQTETRILCQIQQEQFGAEINNLKKDKPVKSAKLGAFNPYIDDNGLLRVGGRLKNSMLTRTQKHPILLPSHHHVTDLIIRETHQRMHHAGIQSTLFALRQKFWLLDGKNQVRKIVHKCVVCIRHRPEPIQYKMVDLPTSRVQGSSAFEHTGLDFCGPFLIKEKRYNRASRSRNTTLIKAYGCIFICMSTRAVHIEIVSDLSTDAFLASFRRFIGRRGIPSHVHSDNGLNFVGANNQLHELYSLLQSKDHQDQVLSFSSPRNITWHFNPPLSPHFGGVWEAAVKSFKHHFKRVVGTQSLMFEELATLAVDIEAILNSRPLCTISTDPNDPIALSPADILIGKKLTSLPDPDLLSVPDNKLSTWRFLTKARQDFWKRWQLEYLNEMQKRHKWQKDGAVELKKGSVVILIDKNKPCMVWELGVITEVYPGSDGVIRVVEVKTARGVYTRNTTTLCPLLPDTQPTS